jgi:hypothetical protein
MNTKIVSAVALALAFTFGSASAEEAVGKSGKPLTAQQLRMKNCNAEAKSNGLSGDERKAFMSTCLKGGASVASGETSQPKAPTAAQLKRKACNDEAKEQGLKGEERKEFVRDCVRSGDLASAS